MSNCIVIGAGLIGQATVQMLKSNNHEVWRYDKDPERSDLTAEELSECIAYADYVFSVVNTNPDGEGLDDTLLRDSIRVFKDGNDLGVFIQRCTTLPGMARALAQRNDITDRYVVFPSFAYRKSAEENEKNPSKIVLGGATLELLTKTAAELFPSGLQDRVFLGTFEDAELSKVASNLLQATIISVWNELKYSVPGASSDFVMETVIQEHNMHSMKRIHGKAWGRGGRLDDDLRAWVDRVGSPIMSAVFATNCSIRERVGEENRSTDELLKQAFGGRLSPNLLK